MSAYFPVSAEEETFNYMKRLAQAPLLSRSEEDALARKVKKGDVLAKKRLIEANMRLVISVARAYRCNHLPMEDLVSEGAVGLIYAAERFDPSRGFRFTTYAMHWIRQSISRAVESKSKAIRLPAHVTQSIRKVEKEKVRLAHELGAEPTHEQLAQAMGICPQKLHLLLQSSQDMVSLDSQIGDHAGVTLGNLLRDPKSYEYEPPAPQREALVQELYGLIKELNTREQQVLRMKLRIESDDDSIDGNDSTDRMVEELKLSRERIRQIEVLAIRKLRVIAARRRQSTGVELDESEFPADPES